MTPDQLPKQPANLQRCDRHGVLFNEERYNSCAVCRASVDSPGMALSSVVLGILGVGLIGAGLALGGGPTVRALAEVGDRAIAETAQAIRLDPSPIRSEIESLETLVYGWDSDSANSGPAIRSAAANLAQSISQLEGAPKRLLERFGRDIEAFGARSDPRQMGDPSSRGLTTSIDWETVRSRVFAEALWYRHSDSGTVALTEQ